MTGRFITLEGSEGGGKSTSIDYVRQLLESAGIEVLVTREPGGTAIGEQIRSLLLDHRNTAMHSDTELLLMFAARAQHLHQVILPALAAGTWVVSDRFTDASFAYQGGGRGISLERIEGLASWVLREFRPDLTLLLDLRPEVGLERTRSRGEADRFERERVEFFGRVRATYLERARQEADRFVVIDAERSVEAVREQIGAALHRLLEAKA